MAVSAGILLYRKTNSFIEYMLVHPGGPYFSKKNEGFWTIPKGEPLPGEAILETAIREFAEETGYTPKPPYIELSPIIQKGGKKVFCWACEGNLDPNTFICNTFTLEWPPKSGLKKEFPEIDKAGWFSISQARILINDRQFAFIEQLQHILQRS